MKKETVYDILNHLDYVLRKRHETNLFGDNVVTLEEIDYICEKYLKFRNYKLAKLPKREIIKKIDDLINYFYSLYAFYKGNECSLVADKKDFIIMSRFVKQRRTYLQCSSQEALQDTAFIIEGLFLYEEELNLDTGVTLKVFGTDKCKWITDKIILLININKTKRNDLKVIQMAKKWSEKEAEAYKGFDFANIEV
jgi:hypothetical protein